MSQSKEEIIREFLLQQIRRLVKNSELLTDSSKDIDTLGTYELLIVLIKAFQLHSPSINPMYKLSLIYEMMFFLVNEPTLKKELRTHKEIKRKIFDRLLKRPDEKDLNYTYSEEEMLKKYNP